MATKSKSKKRVAVAARPDPVTVRLAALGAAWAKCNAADKMARDTLDPKERSRAHRAYERAWERKIEAEHSVLSCSPTTDVGALLQITFAAALVSALTGAGAAGDPRKDFECWTELVWDLAQSCVRALPALLRLPISIPHREALRPYTMDEAWTQPVGDAS